jgi:hypothetical protein
MAITAPLSASFCGCGLWMVAAFSLRTRPTLDLESFQVFSLHAQMIAFLVSLNKHFWKSI